MHSESPTAKRFGASIDMRMSGNGLFLVRFRRESGRERITQAGGRIVYSAGADAVLAVIAVNGYFSLKNDRAIAFIGPVSLDRDRYARIMSLVTGAHLTPSQDK